jgi:hypothetical protein
MRSKLSMRSMLIYASFHARPSDRTVPARPPLRVLRRSLHRIGRVRGDRARRRILPHALHRVRVVRATAPDHAQHCSAARRAARTAPRGLWRPSMTDMENDPTAGMISSGRAALVCVQVDIPRNASAPARLRRIRRPLKVAATTPRSGRTGRGRLGRCGSAGRQRVAAQWFEDGGGGAAGHVGGGRERGDSRQ